MTYLKNLAFVMKNNGKKVCLEKKEHGKVLGFRKGKILVQVYDTEANYGKLYDITDIEKEKA